MIRWLLSEQGSAAGTWVSNIIGTAAIIIAVVAFTNDRRRARIDALRERCRRSEDVLDFLLQAKTALRAAYLDVESPKDTLRKQVESGGPNIPPNIDITDWILRWRARERLVKDLRRAAAVIDASSALMLSHADEALNRLTQRNDLRVYLAGGLLECLKPAETKLRKLMLALEKRCEQQERTVQSLRRAPAPKWSVKQIWGRFLKHTFRRDKT